MTQFAAIKENFESWRHGLNVLSGVLSNVIGLKLDGSVVSPFLCMRTVHAFLHTFGISPDCQIRRNS